MRKGKKITIKKEKARRSEFRDEEKTTTKSKVKQESDPHNLVRGRSGLGRASAILFIYSSNENWAYFSLAAIFGRKKRLSTTTSSPAFFFSNHQRARRPASGQHFLHSILAPFKLIFINFFFKKKKNTFLWIRTTTTPILESNSIVCMARIIITWSVGGGRLKMNVNSSQESLLE